MDIKKIFGAITSLIPFWSNNLVTYFGFGSEYAMTFNIVLSQFIQLAENNCNDKMIIGLFVLVGGVLMFHKLGYNIYDLLKLKKINSITINGYEDVKDTSNTSYPIAMEALTDLFVDKYALTNIIVNKDVTHKISICNMANHKLENDLYLTVSRSGQGQQTVTYELKSYSHDLKKIVSDAIAKYTKQNYTHSLTFYGKEDETTYDYPNNMLHLTYVLDHKYKMSKLIVKNYISSKTTQNNQNQNKNEIANKESDNEKQTVENNISLIDDCINCMLEEDLYITIQRSKNITKYILWSNTINLKDFIQSCSVYYDTNINKNKYKYRLTISGTQSSSDRSGKDSGPGIRTSYPHIMNALNHCIVHKHNINSFKYINTDKDDLINKYVLNGLTTLQFDDIILSINKYVNSTSWYSITEIEYVLQSNTVDIKKYLDNCITEYDAYCKNITKGNIYHFTLIKFNGNNPEWNMEILSGEGKELHQSFDNLHNEHVEVIKKDLKRLKDLDYYKRTGLKRKKSYLFYGEPGCGKTQTVLAMSIEDHRHIIEIPFNIIKNNLQLETIMNLKSINNIQFNKNEVIYLFDEIDTACTLNRESESNKLSSPESPKENKSSIAEALIIASALKENCPLPTTGLDKNESDLNIGNILSKFDGIGNYDGMIIVATTNYKDRLDPALYRELRLSPIYFTYLRKLDAIEIIEKFFLNKLNVKQIEKVPDRKITPAKLIFLCEKHEMMDINEFLELI